MGSFPKSLAQSLEAPKKAQQIVERHQEEYLENVPLYHYVYFATTENLGARTLRKKTAVRVSASEEQLNGVRSKWKSN